MQSYTILLKRSVLILGVYLLCWGSAESRKFRQMQRATNEKIVIPLWRMVSLFNPRKQSIPAVDYFANIFITTQPFNFTFDTGTEEIWIPLYAGKDTNLNYDGIKGYIDVENQPTYGDKGFTYKRVNLKGTIYDDKFTLRGKKGDSNDDHEIKFNQNFLAVKEASNAKFKNRPFNGIIGLPSIAYRNPKSKDLGLDNILTRIYPGESDNAPPEHHMKFSLWFEHKKEYELNRLVPGAEITIGGYNNKRGDKDIKVHKLKGEGWRLNLTNVYFGNKQVPEDKKDRMAELNSGSYFMQAPQNQANFIFDTVKAVRDEDAKLDKVDCDMFKRGDENMFPNLYFIIDETEYTITRSHYITELNHPELGRYCFVNIKGSDKDEWILGTSFLRAFYTTYDSYYGEVGFYMSKQD